MRSVHMLLQRLLELDEAKVPAKNQQNLQKPPKTTPKPTPLIRPPDRPTHRRCSSRTRTAAGDPRQLRGGVRQLRRQRRRPLRAPHRQGPPRARGRRHGGVRWAPRPREGGRQRARRRNAESRERPGGVERITCWVGRKNPSTAEGPQRGRHKIEVLGWCHAT